MDGPHIMRGRAGGTLNIGGEVDPNMKLNYESLVTVYSSAPAPAPAPVAGERLGHSAQGLSEH